MTRTQASIAKLKRGQSVGFVTKAGVVKQLGHTNTLPATIKAKIAAPRKTRRPK